MMEENIATRLKLFLDKKALISSQFADACGIPRPTLSQILTGRNKKISDVLIGQIHHTYPELSIMWLLFGEGEMLQVDNDKRENELENEIIPQENTNDDENGEEIEVNMPQNSSFQSANKAVNQAQRTHSPIVEIAANTAASRKISHITVYYDDSTFETFYPKK